jgi:hypothetical protein
MAVPPRFIFAAGHPGAVVAAVVLDVQVVAHRGGSPPSGLGDGVFRMHLGGVGGGGIPFGDDGVDGILQH